MDCHLFGLSLCTDKLVVSPQLESVKSMRMYLHQNVTSKLGTAHKLQGNASHMSMHVSNQKKHGPFAQNACYTRRVITFKQTPFILKYKVVKL